MSDICAVNWCLDQAVPRYGVCRLHANRPVLHSNEQREPYFARLRREDSHRRSAPHRVLESLAPQPVPLITTDTGNEPDLTRPGYAEKEGRSKLA